MTGNIDWLQLNVRNTNKLIIPLYDDFEIRKLPIKTRQFNKVEEVFLRDVRIATMVSQPHSGIIDKDTILLKFDNHVLYQSELIQFVKYVLNSLQLTFHAFSRIDVALDFTELLKYPNPQVLIKDLLCDNVLQRRQSKISINGRITHGIEIDYIRFGTHESGLLCYMYNKSLEMREKTFKPWIADNWKLQGLNTAKDVWRLEFSITDFTLTFIDQQTGEIEDSKQLEFINRIRSKEIIDTMVNRCFKFVINDRQQRKERMKELILIENVSNEKVIQRMTNKQDSNRSTKIFIKKLHSLNNELRYKRNEIHEDTNKVLAYMLNQTDLTEWYKRSREYWSTT